MPRRFLVVIPTRRRLDTLKWTLKTCLNQDYKNLKVLVLVNSCQETISYLDTLNDARLSYLYSETDLLMSDNWERVFDIGLDDDTYILFLGDDDGLLPGALSKADDILSEYKSSVLSWVKTEYCWPSVIVKRYTNAARISLSDKIHWISSDDFLRKSFKYKTNYTFGPSIYSSFVRSGLLNNLRGEAGGYFFQASAPDVFSSYAIAAGLDKFLRCDFPLSINGASQHSNGVATVHNFKNQSTCNFTGLRPIHPSLVHGPSTRIAEADALLRAKEALPKQFQRYSHAMEDLVAAVKQEIPVVETLDQAKILIQSIHDIERLNRMPESNIQIPESLKNPVSNPAVAHHGFDSEGLILSLDLGRFGIENVFDAAEFFDKLVPLSEKDCRLFEEPSKLASAFRWMRQTVGRILQILRLYTLAKRLLAFIGGR